MKFNAGWGMPRKPAWRPLRSTRMIGVSCWGRSLLIGIVNSAVLISAVIRMQLLHFFWFEIPRNLIWVGRDSRVLTGVYVPRVAIVVSSWIPFGQIAPP